MHPWRCCRRSSAMRKRSSRSNEGSWSFLENVSLLVSSRLSQYRASLSSGCTSGGEVFACNVREGHVPWEAVPIPNGVGLSASDDWRQEQLRRAAGVAAPGSRRRGGEGAAVAGGKRHCFGRQETPRRALGSMTCCAWRRGGRSCCVGRAPFRRAAFTLSKERQLLKAAGPAAPCGTALCNRSHCAVQQEMLLRVANPCARHVQARSPTSVGRDTAVGGRRTLRRVTEQKMWQ